MKTTGIILVSIGGLLAQINGCEKERPTTESGVRQATATVKVQASGFTIEQMNIQKRLEMENMPGSIKHLYVISPYSGQVLIYSTVQGKVTSSGKRLQPYEVGCADGEFVSGQLRGIPISVGGVIRRTPEVLQDDGTYGSSAEYLYWFDSQGRYHQHYIVGGQIVHVCDQPLPVKSITLNLEVTSDEN